jgi:hypothetical protein
MFNQTINDANVNNALTIHVQGRWWSAGEKQLLQAR